MQSPSGDIEIDGMCGWFLSNSAGMAMFLPGLFADIDQLVRIVE